MEAEAPAAAMTAVKEAPPAAAEVKLRSSGD
jgi:hypothetical protein